MRVLLQSLLWFWALVLWPVIAAGAPVAHEIITLAQQQLTVPSEIALGEMRVYRGEHLHRVYAFVLGKRWDADSDTEFVRIDFESPITMADPESSIRTHNRYLLKRTGRTPPTQWLYLPALRRVRLAPYRPEEPLLQSQYWLYDLTAIHDFGDYRYHFVDANEHAPVIEGTPQTGFVPYQSTRFALERRGGTYLLREVTYIAAGRERQAAFSGYQEIAPQRFRPHQLTVRDGDGRTEIVFRQWVLVAAEPQLFTPTALETKALTLTPDIREE